MKVSARKEIKITLVLSEAEARTLKMIMQGPVREYTYDPEKEPIEIVKIRNDIFNAIDAHCNRGNNE